MADNIDEVSWGRVLERLDTLTHKTDRLHEDVSAMKDTTHKGWGVIIAAVAIMGMFAGDLLTGAKKLLGWV